MNDHSHRSFPELRDLGFNEREARVYLALLDQGTATATQLAVASRVPQNKIYESLESLAKAGLCRRQRSGRQSLFAAVDPAVALAAPLGALQDRLEQARRASRDLADRFAAAPRAESSLGDVEVLRHRDAIRERYLKLLAGARRDIAGFSCGPYAYENREDLAAQFDMGKLVDSRCRSRWVYELDATRDTMLVEFLHDNPNVGDVRVADHLPLKMVVFDAQTIIFTDENPENSGEMSVVVMQHPAVVSAFLSLFDFFWADSPEFAAWQADHSNTDSR